MKFSVTTAAAIFLLLILASTLPAQDSTVYCPHFRMLLTDGRHVTGKDGILDNGTFTGTSKDGSSVSLKVEEIRSMDRSVGTKAGTYALMGAGMGLVTVLFAVVECIDNPNCHLDGSKVPPVALGFITAGAIIGAAVGSTSQRWEHVPLSRPMGLVDNRGVRLTLSIHF